MKKYILHIGEVKSEYDSQIHHIGAQQLADIYDVRLDECIVVDYKRPETYRGLRSDNKLIDLYPQEHNEDYSCMRIKIGTACSNK